MLKKDRDDLRGLIDEQAKKFEQVLINNNVSFNDEIALRMKGLIALREPTLFFTRQYNSAGNASYIVFTAKQICFLQWASMQTQTTAQLKLAHVHGNVSKDLISGYGGAAVYHERYFGKGGIKFEPGDTLNIITTSGQATYIQANFSGPKYDVVGD